MVHHLVQLWVNFELMGMEVMMAVVVVVLVLVTVVVVGWVLLVVLVVVLAIDLVAVVVVDRRWWLKPTEVTMHYCYLRNYGTELFYREWEFQHGTLHYCYWRRSATPNGHFQIVTIPESVSKSCWFRFSFLLRSPEFPSISSSPWPTPSSRTDNSSKLDATSTSTIPTPQPGTP